MPGHRYLTLLAATAASFARANAPSHDYKLLFAVEFGCTVLNSSHGRHPENVRKLRCFNGLNLRQNFRAKRKNHVKIRKLTYPSRQNITTIP